MPSESPHLTLDGTVSPAEAIESADLCRASLLDLLLGGRGPSEADIEVLLERLERTGREGR